MSSGFSRAIDSQRTAGTAYNAPGAGGYAPNLQVVAHEGRRVSCYFLDVPHHFHLAHPFSPMCSAPYAYLPSLLGTTSPGAINWAPKRADSWDAINWASAAGVSTAGACPYSARNLSTPRATRLRTASELTFSI